MRRRVGLAALSLSGLALVAGGHPAAVPMVRPGPQPLPETPAQAASVSEPPVVPGVVAPGSPQGHGPTWIAPSSDTLAVGPPLAGDVLAAYWLAVAASPARCHLPITLLMAIGQVESGNLAGHALDSSHRAAPPILGPVLDGTRWRAVPDTDAGQLDGDTRWDRAVGPMQFIPASWRVAGVDMDGDGTRDPQDIYDAAGAAMVYLCAGDRDLATVEGLRLAVLGFNHSTAYLELVLRWKAVFDAAADSPTDPAYAGGLMSQARAWAGTAAAPDGHLGAPETRPGPAGVPQPEVAPASSLGPAVSTPSAPGSATQPGTTPAPATTPEPSTRPTSPDPTPPNPSAAPTPTPTPPASPSDSPPPVTPSTPTPTELPPCPAPTDVATPAPAMDAPVPPPPDVAPTCLPDPTSTETVAAAQTPAPTSIG